MTTKSSDVSDVDHDNDIKEVGDNGQPPQWAYLFSNNNIFLHSISGQEKATKICHVLISKYGAFISLVLVLIPMLLQQMGITPSNFGSYMYFTLVQSLYIPKF